MSDASQRPVRTVTHDGLDRSHVNGNFVLRGHDLAHRALFTKILRQVVRDALATGPTDMTIAYRDRHVHGWPDVVVSGVASQFLTFNHADFLAFADGLQIELSDIRAVAL